MNFVSCQDCTPLFEFAELTNCCIRLLVISAERVWLLPSMKTSSMAAMPRRPSLAFFQDHVLNLARKCDAYSAIHTADVAVASFHRARVVDLWSLFPCFCQHPSDLEKTFPVFSQTLIRAMGDSRYPQLVVSSVLRKVILARNSLSHDCRSSRLSFVAGSGFLHPT